MNKTMDMKKILLIFLIISTFYCFAQNEHSVNYYTIANNLNVRSGSSVDSSVVFKLEKYENILIVQDSSDSQWAKIITQGKEGYVAKKYIKKGKVKIDVFTYRTGAVCRDGTTSSATGRGACSHHGGVSYWLTKEKKTVKIIDE